MSRLLPALPPESRRSLLRARRHHKANRLLVTARLRVRVGMDVTVVAGEVVAACRAVDPEYRGTSRVVVVAGIVGGGVCGRIVRRRLWIAVRAAVGCRRIHDVELFEMADGCVLAAGCIREDVLAVDHTLPNLTRGELFTRRGSDFWRRWRCSSLGAGSSRLRGRCRRRGRRCDGTRQFGRRRSSRRQP
jgi:hypothetical protein